MPGRSQWIKKINERNCLLVYFDVWLGRIVVGKSFAHSLSRSFVRSYVCQPSQLKLLSCKRIKTYYMMNSGKRERKIDVIKKSEMTKFGNVNIVHSNSNRSSSNTTSQQRYTTHTHCRCMYVYHIAHSYNWYVILYSRILNEDVKRFLLWHWQYNGKQQQQASPYYEKLDSYNNIKVFFSVILSFFFFFFLFLVKSTIWNVGCA